MFPKNSTVAVSLIALVVAVTAARAQTGGPVTAVEPIGPFVVVPGQPIELFFDNHFDLDHPKSLYFTGSFTNLDLVQISIGDFWFDWIDPATPGVVQTSPLIAVDLDPGQSRVYVAPDAPGFDPDSPLVFTIPFCPPRVSLHYDNRGPSQGVLVEGFFVHECQVPKVPEPSTVVLAGLSLAGLGVVALRRRRS